jgi:hypothetical protein
MVISVYDCDGEPMWKEDGGLGVVPELYEVSRQKKSTPVPNINQFIIEYHRSITLRLLIKFYSKVAIVGPC